MSRMLSAIVTILLFSLISAVPAQSVDQAVEKFESGDFTGALRDLLPLAEQGFPRAQFNTDVASLRASGFVPSAVFVQTIARIADMVD